MSCALVSALIASQGSLHAVLVFLVMLVTMIAVAGFIIWKGYVRCPSNRVLVVWGRTGASGAACRCIHSGAMFVWPLIQDYAWLRLEPLEVDVPLREAPTMDGIRLNVNSGFTFAIGTEADLMQRAAIRLLGLSADEIKRQAKEIILGRMREVIASSRIDDIYHDRGELLDNVSKSIETEFSKIGLQLTYVDIREITDDSGYLDSVDQSATTAALLEKVLAHWDARRLVGHLLEEGKLNAEDRQEIRRLLDTL